jgi:hypothetical protein
MLATRPSAATIALYVGPHLVVQYRSAPASPTLPLYSKFPASMGGVVQMCRFLRIKISTLQSWLQPGCT